MSIIYFFFLNSDFILSSHDIILLLFNKHNCIEEYSNLIKEIHKRGIMVKENYPLEFRKKHIATTWKMWFHSIKINSLMRNSMKILGKNGISGLIEKMLYIILIGGILIMISLPFTLKYFLMFNFKITAINNKN